MSECKFAVEAFHAYIESIGLSRPAGTLGELKAFKAGADWQRAQHSAPAGWPTDDMVVRGAEELHDSLRMFGIDINFDTKTKGTEIQQEIVEAVFNAMLAAAPKAEQPPVQESSFREQWINRPHAYGDSATPQPVSDDARDAARYRWLTKTSDTNPIMAYKVEEDTLLYGYECDEAIDAAMESKGDE